MDAKQIFEVELPKALEKHSAEAKEFGGKFQLNIEGVGSWHVDMSKASCLSGVAPADCTMTISGPNFEKLLKDPKSVMSMFMFGKLKITGNQMMALKLHKVVSMMKK